MSYSVEEICNLSLSHLGEWQITNIYNESGNVERLCRLHFPQCRRVLLRDHAWNFAIYRHELEVSLTPNVFGYATRFSLPNDYLMKLGLWVDTDATTPIEYFKIEGQALLCDEETAFLEYVADIDCVGMWSSDFIECFTLKLAAALSLPLGAGNKKESLLSQLENLSKPAAWLNNAREDTSAENNPLAEIVNSSNYIRQNEHEI